MNSRDQNDGISLTPVTEGALAEVEKLIDRIDPSNSEKDNAPLEKKSDK